MRTEVARIDIQNEMDLVLAHRRAMQICKFAGISLAEQTRFATAVSEICRNTLEYARKGEIVFSIIKNGDYKCEALITDEGKGIDDLPGILKRNPHQHRGRGVGIVFAKNLVDGFSISSSSKGTRVILEKTIPKTDLPINNVIIQGWTKHMKAEPTLSAYEELKNRNMQLMQMTEELKNERQTVNRQIAEIKSLNEKLESSNEYMKQFTYTISHDLKTPLTSLNLALTLMQESDDPATRQSYIDVIQRASTKLQRTVKGIVEILDIQNNSALVARKVILSETWSEISEQLLLQNRDLVIKPKIDFSQIDELLYIPAYINSIMVNLATNAIKYRAPERELVIDIKSDKQNGYVVLSFQDNGEGIDLKKYGHMIFTPFTRFSPTTEGKGIGLYIIKTMVEKNGGKVEVESERGVGTLFRFYLREFDSEKN